MRNMKIALVLLAVAALVACGKGKDGQVGSNGSSGPKGDQGIIGPVGPGGSDGSTGPQGPQGPAGADGQPAQVVLLCPGVSNYGTFVEVGLCINNRLYGVYSANGGFLTELAPGSYTSNAIGSACNLTVQDNCVVTH